MSALPDIVPVSELRQDAAALLRKLQSGSRTLVVTQRGRAVAVMQSVAEYEKHQHERELLRLLAVGDREVAEGVGYPLDSVMKEADALLRDEAP